MKKHLYNYWPIYIGLVSIISILLIYILKTSSNLVHFSNDRRDWKDFADFFSLILGPVATLSAIFGVWLTLENNRKEKKIDFWITEVNKLSIRVSTLQSLANNSEEFSLNIKRYPFLFRVLIYDFIELQERLVINNLNDNDEINHLIGTVNSSIAFYGVSESYLYNNGERHFQVYPGTDQYLSEALEKWLKENEKLIFN
jgi:hypothetical protein